MLCCRTKPCPPENAGAIFYGLEVWFCIINQGVNCVALIRVTSQVAAINAVQGAALRYLYAMGSDGVLPESAYAAITGVGIYFLLPLLIGTSFAVIAF